jgi:hypothetical protein
MPYGVFKLLFLRLVVRGSLGQAQVNLGGGGGFDGGDQAAAILAPGR